MTATLTKPADIVREVFNGTGARLAIPAQATAAQERLGAESLNLLTGSETPVEAPSAKAWGVAVGVVGLSGAALLVALTALSAVWQGANGASESALAEIPRLQARLEAVAARVDAPREAPAPSLAPVMEKVEAVEARLNESIATVGRRLDAARAEDAALTLRLDKVEGRQAEEASALQALQLRTASIDPAPTASAPAAADMTRLRLKSIKGEVAVVEGPSGSATVSVGDALFDFGKVLKIARHGREGVLVTERGQLTASWPRAPHRRKSADPV